MPRPLSREVRAKLEKVLPLLSSDQPGEQTGAIAAISRILKAGGFDWFDFTSTVTAADTHASSDPGPRSGRRRSTRENQSEHASEDGSKRVASAELEALIEKLRARCQFNTRSEEFLSSLLTSARTCATVRLSAKQLQWLHDLHRQAGL